MDALSVVDQFVLLQPLTQKLLAQHRRARAPCIFCGGPYATTVLYYDQDLLRQGRLTVGYYNTCVHCPERADFRQRVEAEYAGDVAKPWTKAARPLMRLA